MVELPQDRRPRVQPLPSGTRRAPLTHWHRIFDALLHFGRLRPFRRIQPRAWLLVVASGILQVLVFPSFSLFFLCWIALTPLMCAILTGHEPDAVTLLDLS